MLDYEKDLKEKQDEIDYLRLSLKKLEEELQNLKDKIVPIRSRHGITKDELKLIAENDEYEEFIKVHMLTSIGQYLYNEGFINVTKQYNDYFDAYEVTIDFNVIKPNLPEDRSNEKM